jgi:hypothetical protein
MEDKDMRFLDGKPIPKMVLTPDYRNIGQPARKAPVYGVSILEKCLNPDCGREGPIDALMLGPLNLWPNISIICGDKGCGVFWTMIGVPPTDTIWLEVDDAS